MADTLGTDGTPTPPQRSGDDAIIRIPVEGINRLLRSCASVECLDISNLLYTHLQSLNPSDALPFRLLAHVAELRFEPFDISNPFKPLADARGWRSTTPTDFSSGQIDEFNGAATKLSNAGLCARLADVVWTVRRGEPEVAERAVDRYCECVAQVHAERACFAGNDRSAWGVAAQRLLVRASRISLMMKHDLVASKRLKKLLNQLISAAYKKGCPSGLVRIVDVGVGFGLSPQKKSLSFVTKLAEQGEMEPLERARLWVVAARLHQNQQEEKVARDCLVKASGCEAEQAEQLAVRSPLAAAHFFERSRQTLLHLAGTSEFRTAIEQKIQQLQETLVSSDVPAVFEERPSDDELQEALPVRKYSWKQALTSLVHCEEIPSPSRLRDQAIQHAKAFPLRNALNLRNCYYRGAPRLYSQVAETGEEPSEEYIIVVNASLRRVARYVAVANVINPLRASIAESHSIPVEAIHEFIGGSIFVPPGHEEVFAQGIACFIAGQDAVGCSIMIPQLESALRYMLSRHGVDTTTADHEGIQTEASLSQLLTNFYPQLTGLLPKRYLHEMQLLFDFPLGTALRHSVVHGSMNSDEFSDSDAVYGMWFMSHLVLLPVVRRWEDE